MEPQQILNWHRYCVMYFGNINTAVLSAYCNGMFGTMYLYILETCIGIFRKHCSSKVLLIEKWVFSTCIWSG